MKRIGLALAGMFLFSSVGFASPLEDYSKGKAAIDLTYRSYKDMDSTIGLYGLGDPMKAHDQLGGKGDYEWGMTLGLGNDWAVQYRGFNAEAKKTYAISGEEEDYNPGSLSVTINPKVKSQEVNVLRKLNKNFSVFAGLVRVTPSIKVTGNHTYTEGGDVPTLTSSNSYSESASLTLGGEDKNIGQIGIIASTKLADKTNLYGIASVGKDYRNWETGIAYGIAKDTELNVSYRSAKYDNLKIAGASLPSPVGQISPEVKSDVETKGWGFGVTYKF